jgi:hypothetical protein
VSAKPELVHEAQDALEIHQVDARWHSDDRVRPDDAAMNPKRCRPSRHQPRPSAVRVREVRT